MYILGSSTHRCSRVDVVRPSFYSKLCSGETIETIDVLLICEDLPSKFIH